MTRRGQDVSHLHCQSRTNNIKFVIYSAVSASQILLPQRDLGYMRTHTPTGAGAHHTCGTHLLCRHSLKPALAGKMCNTIALETMGTPGSQEKHASWFIVAYLILIAGKRLFALLRQRVSHPNQPLIWTHDHAHGDHARSWNSKVATLFPIILVAAGRKESRQKEWIVCGISMVRRRGGCTQTISWNLAQKICPGREDSTWMRLRHVFASLWSCDGKIALVSWDLVTLWALPNHRNKVTVNHSVANVAKKTTTTKSRQSTFSRIQIMHKIVDSMCILQLV